MAATVTPISPAVSNRRAAALAARKTASAERKAKLESMTDEQKAQFKASEKAARQEKRAASQQNRSVRVKVAWLVGLSDTLVATANAARDGKTLTFGGESFNVPAALNRMAVAIKKQAVPVAKSLARAADKIFVIVRTSPDGSKLADDKTFRGAKGQEKAQAAATKKQDFLQAAQIAGYSFSVMTLAAVQAEGIEWLSQQGQAA